jgi:hypothetical protein
MPVIGRIAELREAVRLRVRERFWPGAAEAPQHIALGTFCHVAAALRETGLRGWTGPFDWIFSTPGMVADCIADDFSALLDPRHLRSVPAGQLTHGARKQCRHLLFEARYDLPPLFNHHDPAALPADLKALERSVGRMRRALHGRRQNILYMMSEVTWPDAEIARLAAQLGALPSRNTLAFITLLRDGDDQSLSMRERAGTGTRVVDVEIGVRTRSSGVRFADPADDLHLTTVLRGVSTRLVAAG